MFGKNPKRTIEKHSGNFLHIKNIFRTIQAEGPYTGSPSIFIRLGGCNLTCEFCDTDFEDYYKMPIIEIISTVENLCLNYHIKLIVITGGEPLRQPIAKLCELLISKNFTVQIETNGTLYRDLHKDVKIVCSPKNNNSGYKSIRPDLLSRVTAFKFLISKTNQNYNYIPNLGQEKYNIPVYLQPMDEYNKNKNKINTDYAIELAMKNNYILSLQIHKFIGIE